MNMLDNWSTEAKEAPFRAELIGSCYCPCCRNAMLMKHKPQKYVACMYTRCKLYGKKFEVPMIELKEVS